MIPREIASWHFQGQGWQVQIPFQWQAASPATGEVWRGPTTWGLYSEPSEPLPATIITHNCHTKPLTKQKAYRVPLLWTKFYNIGKNTTFQLSTFLSDPHSSGLKSESTIILSSLGIITDEPTLEEVTYAIKKLWNGHATDLDSLRCMPATLHHIHSITPGLLKCAMNPVSSEVYISFHRGVEIKACSECSHFMAKQHHFLVQREWSNG